MKKSYFFGIGCLIPLLLFIYIFWSGYRASEAIYLEKAPIQYFDVTTNKGTFQLHTQMPKDSVKLILGRPNTEDVSVIGNTVDETYTYKKEGFHQLQITFEDGKLKSVRNY